MEKPSLEILNNDRKEGFRPGVVACIISEEKILFLFKKEYKLWMLPQGSIGNRKDIIDELQRTLEEELGAQFCANLDFADTEFIGEDSMEFKPGRHSLDELFDDSGNKVDMVGKKYYFSAINSKTEKIDIEKTKFNEYFWLDYKEAGYLADKIYQKGKRRVTLNVLVNLYKLKIIK